MHSYYYEKFQSDLLNFMGNSSVPYFGHTWRYDCKGLERVSISRRPAFLICLYFTVLVDQAMHCYFRGDYQQFAKLTRYPKFCHGLGQFQFNPRGILFIPVEKGFVEATSIIKLLPDGMKLFVEEVDSFFKSYMPQISVKDFFEKLRWDSDVQIPELLAILNPEMKDDVVYIAYKQLVEAIEEKYG